MKITRRFFLRSTGLLAAYCGLAPLQAFATTDTPSVVKKNKSVVVIFLRGGVDGLNLVVPFKDPFYYQLRGSIAIPTPGNRGGALDLDGFFGLHPRAKSLLPLFQKGQMAILNAVGYNQGTRSHFAEQDVWETGVVGNTIHSDGWLNRHLATSEGHGPLRAVAIGDILPRILRGKEQAFAIRGLDELLLRHQGEDGAMMGAALEHAYQKHAQNERDSIYEVLNQASQTTLKGMKILGQIANQSYRPKAPYPNTPIAEKLKSVAQLLKADIGLEVAEIDYGGWDTHRDQGNAAGPFANLTQNLADAIASFVEDMGEKMDDVLVVTLSEFGRTARENGSRGTDHGWGNCMFAFGGPILQANKSRQSPIVGSWPGLAPEQLHQNRDLQNAVDFRDVIGEIITAHLGNSNIEKVLPQHEFNKVGLL